MEIKFGKHKGKTFDQVPKSYQLWLLKNNLVHIECAEWFFEKFLDEQLVKIRKDRQKTFHVFTTASILSAIPNTKLNLQKYELINNYSDGKSFKIEVKFK
jgi:hypothetical protein